MRNWREDELASRISIPSAGGSPPCDAWINVSGLASEKPTLSFTLSTNRVSASTLKLPFDSRMT